MGKTKNPHQPTSNEMRCEYCFDYWPCHKSDFMAVRREARDREDAAREANLKKRRR